MSNSTKKERIKTPFKMWEFFMFSAVFLWKWTDSCRIHVFQTDLKVYFELKIINMLIILIISEKRYLGLHFGCNFREGKWKQVGRGRSHRWAWLHATTRSCRCSDASFAPARVQNEALVLGATCSLVSQLVTPRQLVGSMSIPNLVGVAT